MIGCSKRAQKEQVQTSLNQYVRQSKVDMEKNNWLLKSETQQPNVNRTAELAKVQLRKKEMLEIRRSKLKELLSAEDSIYKAELMASQKKPDQIVNEMREKVKKLKEENERERNEEVQRLRTLQLKANAEELKLIAQKAAETRTQVEREIQLKNKKSLIERLADEERLYAHLTKLQIRDKILEEKRIREERMERIKSQNAILQKQIEDIAQQRKEQLEALEVENANFKETCKRLLVDERQKLERQREINRRMADEVRQYNEYQLLQKEEKKKREAEEERLLVQAQIERERMLNELEKLQKEKYKKETKEYLKQIKARTDEMKLNQKLIDQLINEEIELQWKKRQEVWAREEKARINLLKEVYAHRYQNIEDKKQRRIDERNDREKEKEQVRQQTAQFAESERQTLMNELKKMNLYKEAIMKQIQEKFEFDQKERFLEMEEDRKRHLMELEYQQAVQEEMRKGEQLIEEIKKLRELS